MIDTQHCLICQKRNRTLHWHTDPDTKDIWVYCVGKCQRGYSIRSYCYHANLSLPEFLKGDFDFKEALPNEVTAMAWPSRYVPLSDSRAEQGVSYIISRGLSLEGDMYYDVEREGIVFPYYLDSHFCGAQTRFVKSRVHSDGEIQKIDTLPGTRLGLLFYGWNQSRFVGNVKGIIVTEGAFNAISINQALNLVYGGIANNPWRAVACSGAGVTKHHKETLKELKEQGLKVVVAADTDEAGANMLNKMKSAEACTHYAFTGHTEDWNEKLKELGHKEFARFFFSCVKVIT
jgi:hypothetical protein